MVNYTCCFPNINRAIPTDNVGGELIVVNNKPRKRICILLICLFGLSACTLAQGGSRIGVYIGLQLQNQPVADAGIMLKYRWVFDSSLSNDGPGAGCEVNFGTNNSGITIGPKLFYQASVFMASFGSNKKSNLYLLVRLSGIRYTNKHGNNYRIAPEGGISLADRVSLLYGYNFPVPFNGSNEIEGVFNNRLTLILTFGKKQAVK